MVLKKLKRKVDGRAKNADPEDFDIEYNDSAVISKKSDKKLSKRAVKKEKKRVAKIFKNLKSMIRIIYINRLKGSRVISFIGFMFGII
jgi:hypothetical protein